MNDPAPLTPSIILQEIISSDVMDFDIIAKQKVNKTVKYRQHVREQFRKRFRIQYIGQLRQQNTLEKMLSNSR